MKATAIEAGNHHNVLRLRTQDGGKVLKNKHKEKENEEIQAYLTKLQELVPFMPKNKKLTKLEVIQHVIDYIRDLRQTLGLPLQSPRVPFDLVDPMEMMSQVVSSANNNNVILPAKSQSHQ